MTTKLETPRDILKALLDRKKIRWTGWDSSYQAQYIYLREDGRIIDDKGDDAAYWSWQNSAIDHWEVFEEKNKVYRRKWIRINKSYRLDCDYYPSKEDFDGKYAWACERSEEWEETEI